MGETRSKTQFPMAATTATPPAADFQRGLQVGREAAQTAIRRIGAWAEENPGQMVLAGLALGFVLGKLLFGRRTPVSEDLE
jgi:ElaB/YqjD/DUF883 family membrane-anchored ribosome-binding protein